MSASDVMAADLAERLSACAPDRLPKSLKEELRSSHAGELGAVWIYRGILLVSSDAEVIAFAKAHIKTEQSHLALFEDIIHLYRGSLLLPLWIVAGFLTGLLPALFGKRAVFGTIAAVEAFVSAHYARQIAMFRHEGGWEPLVDMLQTCREDEIAHQEDAAARVSRVSVTMLVWQKVVAVGSAIAVSICKKI